MSVQDLPALNASLNAASLLLLLAGYGAIRSGKRDLHRALMLSAFTVSIAFLVSYLYYHAHVGHVPFPGTGWVRPFYFTILITHVLLAALVPVMAVVTIRRAWRGDFERHKRLARVTYPLWVYVGATGVLVYLMVYKGFLQ